MLGGEFLKIGSTETYVLFGSEFVCYVSVVLCNPAGTANMYPTTKSFLLTFVETIMTLSFAFMERLVFLGNFVFRIFFLVLIGTEFEDAASGSWFLETIFGLFAGGAVHSE